MGKTTRCVFTFVLAGVLVAISGCTSPLLAEPETRTPLPKMQRSAEFQRDMSARRSESNKNSLRAYSPPTLAPSLASIAESMLPAPLLDRLRADPQALSAGRNFAGPTSAALLALRASPTKPVASMVAAPRQPIDLKTIRQMYASALQLERAAQARDAVSLYRVASTGGNSNASVRLMELYVTGAPGVPRDYARAIYYKSKALEQGAELSRSPRY